MFGDDREPDARRGLFADETALDHPIGEAAGPDNDPGLDADLDPDVGVSDHTAPRADTDAPDEPSGLPLSRTREKESGGEGSSPGGDEGHQADERRSPIPDDPSLALLDAGLDPDVGVSEDHAAPADPVPDAARLSSAIRQLAEIGDDGRGGVTRLAYTSAERAAHAAVARWLDEAGFVVRTDAAGNTIGERPGLDDRPCIVLGSHLDSVPSGGRFDGSVGVISALEVGRMIQQAGIVTRHPLRIVAFAGEEGARFGEACLGSRAVTGQLDPRDTERLHDDDGLTLAAAMVEVGLDPTRMRQARWEADEVAATLELHVEQGGILDTQGLAIGIVDALAGHIRLRVTLSGQPNHSGSTPMDARRDALAGAAEMVVAVEQLASGAGRRGVVATVGQIDVAPNSPTTIPGRVTFSVDVRDVDSDRQHQTAREIVVRVERIADRRGLDAHTEVVADTSPSVLPLWLRRFTKQVCVDLGLAHRVMASGAGHDTQILARRWPAALLFVPSHAGVSHASEERTSVDEIVQGTRALFGGLLRLDRFLADEIG